MKNPVEKTTVCQNQNQINYRRKKNLRRNLLCLSSLQIIFTTMPTLKGQKRP